MSPNLLIDASTPIILEHLLIIGSITVLVEQKDAHPAPPGALQPARERDDAVVPLDGVPRARRGEQAAAAGLVDAAGEEPDERRGDVAEQGAAHGAGAEAREERRGGEARELVDEGDARVRGGEALERQGQHGGGVGGAGGDGEVPGVVERQVVLVDGALLAAGEDVDDARAPAGLVEQGEEELGDPLAGVVPRRQAGVEPFARV